MIEKNVRSDPVWKGLSERREWWVRGEGRWDNRWADRSKNDEWLREEEVDFGTTRPLQTVCVWAWMVSCCLPLLSVGANTSSIVLLPQKGCHISSTDSSTPTSSGISMWVHRACSYMKLGQLWVGRERERKKGRMWERWREREELGDKGESGKKKGRGGSSGSDRSGTWERGKEDGIGRGIERRRRGRW